MRAWSLRNGSKRTSTGTEHSATFTPTIGAVTSGRGRLVPVRGIKEGDTPSFLSLVPNGLSDPVHPWLGSWGGRFQGNGHLTDRHPRPRPRHEGRPGPPYVLGVPLATGVPG